jgi:hypothetical protein
LNCSLLWHIIFARPPRTRSRKSLAVNRPAEIAPQPDEKEKPVISRRGLNPQPLIEAPRERLSAPKSEPPRVMGGSFFSPRESPPLSPGELSHRTTPRQHNPVPCPRLFYHKLDVNQDNDSDAKNTLEKSSGQYPSLTVHGVENTIYIQSLQWFTRKNVLYKN